MISKKGIFNILIVDDNPDHAQLAKDKLLSTNPEYQINIAHSGTECLKLLSQNNFDILLLDYNLPKENGLELLSKLRKMYQLPVIFVTGQGNEKIAVNAIKSGAYDYITKSTNYLSILPLVVEKAITAFQTKKLQAKLQKSLEESEEKYRDLVENANDLICTLDSTGKITTINKQAISFFHYSKNEILKMNLKHFISPDVRKNIPTFIRKTIEQGTVSGFKTKLTNKEGKEIIVEINASLIKQNGEISGIRTIIRDITQREKMEGEIKKSKHYLENLFASIQDAIFCLKPDTTIASCNEAAEKIFNYSKQTMLGKKLTALSTDDRKIFSLIKKIIDPKITKKIYAQEVLMKKKDGKKFPAELQISSMKNKKTENTEILVTIKDISERKQLQLRLIQADKMVTLGQLAGGVAHEINNPLTSVMGNAQLLLMQLPPTNPGYTEIQKIEQSAQRCKSIVTNLLGFSRQQEFEFQATNVNEIINRTLSLYERQLTIENIRVVKKYAKNLPKLKLSAPQIQQVFLNLIVNAQQSMPSGGNLTISTEISNTASSKNKLIDNKQSEKNITITFQDQGMGIEKESLARIFDPFFSTKEVGNNTGLGLSVSYGIIKKHKGNIRAKSNGKGKGSKFVIILPLETEKESL
ncbi:PAS domain S-box protein [bacterium]|nr:PAS domain S-box protein [bacterium]